jgi:hypothetical protein
MSAVNVVRIVISVFLVVLIGVAVSGWVWTGGHQPPAQSAASRIVLTVCIVAGVVGLTVIWRVRPTR